MDSTNLYFTVEILTHWQFWCQTDSSPQFQRLPQWKTLPEETLDIWNVAPRGRTKDCAYFRQEIVRSIKMKVFDDIGLAENKPLDSNE